MLSVPAPACLLNHLQIKRNGGSERQGEDNRVLFEHYGYARCILLIRQLRYKLVSGFVSTLGWFVEPETPLWTCLISGLRRKTLSVASPNQKLRCPQVLLPMMTVFSTNSPSSPCVQAMENRCEILCSNKIVLSRQVLCPLLHQNIKDRRRERRSQWKFMRYAICSPYYNCSFYRTSGKTEVMCIPIVLCRKVSINPILNEVSKRATVRMDPLISLDKHHGYIEDIDPTFIGKIIPKTRKPVRSGSVCVQMWPRWHFPVGLPRQWKPYMAVVSGAIPEQRATFREQSASSEKS